MNACRKLKALPRPWPTAGRSRQPPANSSGIFLGDDYHFDLVRPGAALYGVAPVARQPIPCARDPPAG